MNRGTQVWWRGWQGTIVGYEPGRPDEVHVDLHQHKTQPNPEGKVFCERHRFFDVHELSLTPPAGVAVVDMPEIPDHPYRKNVVHNRPT